MKPTTIMLGSQAGNLAFQHRRQATGLRELAQRYELEATALAAMKGAEHEQTLRSRELAKTFWAAPTKPTRLRGNIGVNSRTTGSTDPGRMRADH